MQYIFEVFERDGAIDAEVRTRASGRRTIERDIDSYRPVHRGGINADDMARNCPVTCVDDGALIKLNISGLCFGDLDFSLELRGIGDPCDGRPNLELLSDLKRPFIPEALQNPRNPARTFKASIWRFFNSHCFPEPLTRKESSCVRAMALRLPSRSLSSLNKSAKDAKDAALAIHDHYNLAGVPEDVQRVLVSPGATNWISPLKSTDRGDLVIAADINDDLSNAWWATATAVAHTRAGSLVAPTGSRPSIAAPAVGAQGGNVGYLDGSVRWRNIRAMEPHVASDINRPAVIGYW